MPSRKKHTNPFLLLIAIALCLVLGVTLRQSTADFSILEETSSSMTASSDSQKQDKTDSDQKENSAPSATASPTPAKKPSDSKRKVSDEAASGVWTSSGSNWHIPDGSLIQMAKPTTSTRMASCRPVG